MTGDVGAAVMRDALLRVTGLSVSLPTARGHIRVLSDVSLQLRPGETLGILGASGSGKTTLGRSLLDCLPAGAVVSGRIEFRGRVVFPPADGLRPLRGKQIALVLQNAHAALNPVFRIGTQMHDILRSLCTLSRSRRQDYILEMLRLVGFEKPRTVAQCYPHELSGGMAQRVVIAMALLLRPALLVADEPTSALDIASQVEIIRLLRRLQQVQRFAMLLISHDVHVVMALAHRLAVMQAGRLVELGETRPLLRNRLDCESFEARLGGPTNHVPRPRETAV